MAEWIWLSEKEHPRLQHCAVGIECPGADEYSYAVAEFEKTVALPDGTSRLSLLVGAEAHYELYVNGCLVGTGPASPGGDFLMKERLSWLYGDRITLEVEGDAAIYARVRLTPLVLTEITTGRGGFFLDGEAKCPDGQSISFGTDETWRARVDASRTRPGETDRTKPCNAWEGAEAGEERQMTESPLPRMSYEVIRPCRVAEVAPGVRRFTFDRVYSAYVVLEAREKGDHAVLIREVPGQNREEFRESFRTDGAERLMTGRMYSAGEVDLEGEGEITLLFRHYPTPRAAVVKTGEPDLDKIFDVCRHTLMICRQDMHLDSPLHQELLACTGDYYIETCMESLIFGDMTLAKLDIERTCRFLMHNDGRMFHTNYSLIAVDWILFVYHATGDRGMVRQTLPALRKLFARFESYRDDTGLVGNAPDYMFVDWVMLDGYNMHHPPRYLGETVLNAFYCRALACGEELFRLCGEDAEADRLQVTRAEVRNAFRKAYWCAEKGMFRDGRTDAQEATKWRPENPPREHFSRYSQCLAALFGLCDEKDTERLIDLAAADDSPLPPVQPYFTFFILRAVWEKGLFGKYGLKLLHQWDEMVRECDRGLAEGWLPVEEFYTFDHSHAWGGAPGYFLPLALTGCRMRDGVYTFEPNAWGLGRVYVSLPLPDGTTREFDIREDGV